MGLIHLWGLESSDTTLSEDEKRAYTRRRVKDLLQDDKFCHYGLETRTEDDGPIFVEYFLFFIYIYIQLIIIIAGGEDWVFFAVPAPRLSSVRRRGHI